MKKMKLFSSISLGLACLLGVGAVVTAASLSSKNEAEVKEVKAVDEELVAELNTSDIANMSVGATSYTNSYGTWNIEPSISGITDNKDRFTMTLQNTGGSGVGCSVYINTGREKLTRIEVTAAGNKVQSGDYQVRLFIWRGKKGGSSGEYYYKFIDNMSTDLATYSFNFSEIKVPSVEKGNVIVNFDRLEKKTTTASISNIKIYAEPDADKVTLDQQSGSGGTSSIDAYPDKAMPSITLPSRTGYTFGGYYTSTGGSGTQYYTSSGASARNWTKGAASTLYAKWSAISYNVAYNANKPSNATGNVTGVPSGRSCTYDVNFNLGSAPSLTGWTFGGWYRESSCTNKVGNAGASVKNLSSTAGSTVNLYAKWTANKYNVQYNANKPTYASSSVTDLPSSQQWTYDSNAT